MTENNSSNSKSDRLTIIGCAIALAGVILPFLYQTNDRVHDLSVEMEKRVTKIETILDERLPSRPLVTSQKSVK